MMCSHYNCPPIFTLQQGLHTCYVTDSNLLNFTHLACKYAILKLSIHALLEPAAYPAAQWDVAAGPHVQQWFAAVATLPLSRGADICLARPCWITCGVLSGK